MLGVLVMLSLPMSAQAAGQKVIILSPGGLGNSPTDFLIRNRGTFDRAGFTTIVALHAGNIVAAAAAERRKGNRVYLVGMSKGTVEIARAIAGGTQADAAVFVSALSGEVIQSLGSSSRLPPSLVVQNAADECPRTRPQGAQRMAGWSGGRMQLALLSVPGGRGGNPCGEKSPHAFSGGDNAPVAAILSFIRSR
jgi:hypothetical protein